MRKPKYVHAFRTRHGKLYLRFRRPGFKSVPLPVTPYNSPEFEAAYQAAMSGEAPDQSIGANRTKPGTFNALIVSYYNSTAFHNLAAETQRTRRNILERFRTAKTSTGIIIGDARIADLKRHRVEKMVAEKITTPAAARNFRNTLHALMQFAVSNGFRDDDPTQGVKAPKIRTAGFASWDETHIAQFEAAYSIGTRPRLALALLLFTAQRRGDVVRMGRQHIRAGLLKVRQQKTGTELEIPVHPELQQIIEATVTGQMTLLQTEFGKPFSAAGFTNIFRRWCAQAGLPKGYSAHGLRKAARRRLAEAGCSAMQIMAISGHRSLSEAEKYVRAVHQVRLAQDGIKAVAARFPDAKTGTQIGKPE